MPRLLLFFIISLLLTSRINAQSPRTEPTNILYSNERIFGIFAHTKGKGLILQFTKHISGDRYRLLDFSLYDQKHPKEIKMQNLIGSTDTKPYVFGKANALYILKTNYGRRFNIADRYAQQDVRININYSFGPVLGLLRPVYYEVNKPNSDGKIVTEQQKFDINDPNQHLNIVGAGSAFKGFKQLSFLPGANAKISINFEWGAYEYKFYSLETGLQLDAFPKDVPIFAYQNVNQPVFVNFFLALTYGTRY